MWTNSYFLTNPDEPIQLIRNIWQPYTTQYISGDSSIPNYWDWAKKKTKNQSYAPNIYLLRATLPNPSFKTLGNQKIWTVC